LVLAFIGISDAVLRQNGFQIQARHVMPAALTLPLIAGWSLGRAGRSPRADVALIGLLGLLAVIQWSAFAFASADRSGPIEASSGVDAGLSPRSA
jgi:hypothetical protein